MKPGTTPKNTFTLPFTPPIGSDFRIVYAQGEEYKEKILFDKKTADCKIDANIVTVRLKKEETKLIDSTPKWHQGKFRPYPVKIQIGISTQAGDELWSRIIFVPPGRVLAKDGVV